MKGHRHFHTETPFGQLASHEPRRRDEDPRGYGDPVFRDEPASFRYEDSGEHQHERGGHLPRLFDDRLGGHSGPHTRAGQRSGGPREGAHAGDRHHNSIAADYARRIANVFKEDRDQVHSAGEYPRQSQRGRGPKNYRRSQARVMENIHESLTMDPDVDATDISVACDADTITLSGHVAERWMKHRAEDIAASAAGDLQIDNRIDVTRSPRR